MSYAFPRHVDNPYLNGKYAPVFQESAFDGEQLKVLGEIPKDLNGIYVRNGPNPRFEPKGRHHWFDGDAMLHALAFENGKVSYRNRWVETRGLKAEIEAGRALFGGLIEPDFSNPLGPMKDTANTDVIFHNGEIVALWYRSGEPYAVNPLTLETKYPLNYNGKLKRSLSAHAKVDPVTGELLIFHYGPKPPYMYYGVVSPKGELRTWVPVELPGERFPHDMGVTENYSILMDLPVMHNPEALKQGKWRQDFRPELPSRFAIIPRHGTAGDIRWFEARPCYIYHIINCWEDGDWIIMDGCRVADPIPPREPNETHLSRMLKQLRLKACLWRWQFNLCTGETRESQLDDLNSEFPSINNLVLGRPSRFAYNVTIPDTETLLFDGIVKYDTRTGKRFIHKWGEGCWGSESPFAPRDNHNAEDDGYVVSFVYDELNDRSECRVLAADDIEAGPIARIVIPQRVPLGYHATWICAKDLPGASSL